MRRVRIPFSFWSLFLSLSSISLSWVCRVGCHLAVFPRLLSDYFARVETQESKIPNHRVAGLISAWKTHPLYSSDFLHSLDSPNVKRRKYANLILNALMKNNAKIMSYLVLTLHRSVCYIIHSVTVLLLIISLIGSFLLSCVVSDVMGR